MHKTTLSNTDSNNTQQRREREISDGEEREGGRCDFFSKEGRPTKRAKSVVGVGSEA